MFARGCHEVSQHLDKNLLFSMTKDYITLHVWDDDGCVNSSSGHIHLVNLSEPVYSIPLCTGKSFGFRDIFFTPGLHLYGDNLGFIKQMPMFETHTIGKPKDSFITRGRHEYFLGGLVLATVSKGQCGLNFSTALRNVVNHV